MTWRDHYRQILTTEEFARLEALMNQVLKLRESRYLKRDGNVAHIAEVTARGGGSVAVVSDHGDPEELHSLLLKLRKLLLQKEPTFIDRVVNDLIHREPTEVRQAALLRSRDEIRKARKEPAEATLTDAGSAGMAITTGRTNADLLDDVLNKQLFHTDKCSVDPLLPDMSGPTFEDESLTEVVCRQNLLHHILDECAYATWLSDFVESAKSGT